MLPENKLRFQNILIILIISLVFGLLYNLFFYPHTLTEFLEAGSISLLLGLFLGILEEFIFKKVFSRLPLYKVLIIRTLLYSLLISAILSLVLSIEIAAVEQLTYLQALVSYLRSPLFLRDFIFSISFLFLIIFLIQVIQLIGKANFIRLIMGVFHQPREVERTFMFLDLTGSTTIAEKLDNMAYSNFIKDFFFDISDAIILYKGEVYQYVGDEVIVIWPVAGRSSDCIRCFFKMREIIDNKREVYQGKYDLLPRFKAAIHTGRVVVTEIGKLKKDIVYHGDVLNTTSRIEGKCNELNQELLISEDTLKLMGQAHHFKTEKMGTILLRGKARNVNIFAVYQETE